MLLFSVYVSGRSPVLGAFLLQTGPGSIRVTPHDDPVNPVQARGGSKLGKP